MNSHPSLSQRSKKANDGHNPAEPDISALLQYLATSLLERYIRTFVVAGPIDLAVSIGVFQAASRLRPSNHPQRSDTLDNLAIAFFIRYKVGRKGSDLSRAITIHREALRLQRPDGFNLSSSEGHLANASLRRLKRHGGDIPIHLIIGKREEGLNAQPPGYPSQFQREQNGPTNTVPSGGQDEEEMAPFRMHEVALAALERYEREGGPALLTKSIQLFKSVLSLLLPGHPIRLYPLNNLGTAIHARYKQDGVEQDLSDCIDLIQESLSYQPPGHSNRSSSLKNLALAMMTRYERFGEEQDLSHTIELYTEVLSLQPPNHPDRLPLMSDLATAILKRYHGYGREHDLSDAIKRHREVLSLRPPGHPARPSSLCSLSSAIRARYETEGRDPDLLEGIELSREALSLRPPGHPERWLPLNNLAGAIIKRYERYGREQDLSYVISLDREAVSLQPLGHRGRLECLNSLAHAILTRYERFGGEGDLSEVIKLHMEILSLRPSGHPSRSISLNNLATALHRRFRRDGREQDLSDVVELHREALSLRPRGHPDRSISLNNLANALHTRFEREGRERDLTDSIELHRETLSLRPVNHPDHSFSLINLANAIMERYNRDHEEQDLLDVIGIFRNALNFFPPGRPARSGSLSNLAGAIHSRYERYGEDQDLSDVIELHSEALVLRPAGHPDRSSSLNNLANATLARYRRYKGEKDLLDGIELHREVLSLRPPGHSGRSSSLKNLASALLTRYRRYDGERDVSEVIELEREALSLRPPGHPGRTSALGSLADALIAGYGRRGIKQSPAFVEEIVQLLRDAAANRTSPIPDRLREALRWIDFAINFDSKSALEAYQFAFVLLGGALTLGRSLKARHGNLLSDGPGSRSTKGLALDAALWALTGTSSNPKLAVELLDQGRNVLLASVGQFRADVSDIRREDPALAEEFHQTSRLLDSAISTGQEISEGKSAHEDPTSRYKRVSAKWEAVVAKIRLLPGCESFLLPMPYTKLQEAAVNGPVIVIVVGKERSTAIIVKSVGGPHQVDLPRASEEALKNIYGELDDALGALPNPGPVMKEMRHILSDLWNILVQPIIHALQNTLLVATGSRIWWYPTSWASFLPLHAAGSYKNGEANVPDIYISSYTPTLQALRRSQTRLNSNTDSSTGTLIVSQPQTPGQIELPCVDEEVRIVSRLASDVLVLSDDEGTRHRVLKEFRSHSWIHLACHGDSDPSDPFKSHFALHDGPLSLQDIIANDLPSADFAFLSACRSAAQDRTLPDEGLALAGGMHFAGFKSVVGTLWGMADDDAPALARKFYKGLAERSGDGKPFDCTKTAEALHEAVQGLRKKKVPLFRWVNLVHYGI